MAQHLLQLYRFQTVALATGCTAEVVQQGERYTRSLVDRPTGLARHSHWYTFQWRRFGIPLGLFRCSCGPRGCGVGPGHPPVTARTISENESSGAPSPAFARADVAGAGTAAASELDAVAAGAAEALASCGAITGLSTASMLAYNEQFSSLVGPLVPNLPPVRR